MRTEAEPIPKSGAFSLNSSQLIEFKLLRLIGDQIGGFCPLCNPLHHPNTVFELTSGLWAENDLNFAPQMKMIESDSKS